jgi:HEAT repeat protein
MSTLSRTAEPSSTPPAPSNTAPSASASSSEPAPSTAEKEIDEAIRMLLDPHGGRGHNHAKGEAFEVLETQPELATRRLLTLAGDSDPPVVVLLALGRLGREESIGAIARALESASDPTTVIAAQALAEHPSPRALRALQKGLRSPRSQVVVSSALGLAERGDKAACPALQAAASHPDAEVRGRLTKARNELGCR